MSANKPGPVPTPTPGQTNAASTPPTRPQTHFTPPGWHSNAAITRRNGGVRHQFIDDIGGCSANYR
jgi:hypothetical protein